MIRRSPPPLRVIPAGGRAAFHRFPHGPGSDAANAAATAVLPRGAVVFVGGVAFDAKQGGAVRRASCVVRHASRSLYSM